MSPHRLGHCFRLRGCRVDTEAMTSASDHPTIFIRLIAIMPRIHVRALPGTYLLICAAGVQRRACPLAHRQRPADCSASP